MNTTSDTLLNGIAEARKNGYEHEFRFENDQLIDYSSKKSYDCNSIVLMNYLRYEGFSNPDDSSILFLVKCDDGKLGYISSAYGIYADPALFSYMKKAKRSSNIDNHF